MGVEEYDFNEVIEKICERENIKDAEIKTDFATNKGDGYLGIIKALDLAGSNKDLHLILKYSPRSAKLHETMPIHAVFVRENNFYDRVYPILRKFQEDHNIENRFENIAECYATVSEKGQELLVLENLRSSGYDLWDRKRLMNGEHIDFVFGTFARMHGASFAMKTLNPERFRQELADKVFGGREEDVFAQILVAMGIYKQMNGFLHDLVPLFDSENYYERFATFADNGEDIFREIMEAEEKDSVVTQGDCWCNNMMFKYDENDDEGDRVKPKGMKLLDFQMARIASPILDLSYFFYASASQEALDNFNSHLMHYHGELTKYLSQYGLKAQEVYSLEKFVGDWKRYSRFGLIMGIMVKLAMLTESGNGPDMSKSAEDNTLGDFINDFKLGEKQDVEYKLQVRRLVEHFVRNGYI